MKLVKFARNEVTSYILDGWRVWKDVQGEKGGETTLKNHKNERLIVSWQFEPHPRVEVVRNRKVVKFQLF